MPQMPPRESAAEQGFGLKCGHSSPVLPVPKSPALAAPLPQEDDVKQDLSQEV